MNLAKIGLLQAAVRTPNTLLIYLKKGEFYPLSYLTKKKKIFMSILAIRLLDKKKKIFMSNKIIEILKKNRMNKKTTFVNFSNNNIFTFI